MASAIGTTFISTILQPMVDKAMDIIKDKGKAIVKYIADKATDKAMDIIKDKGKAIGQYIEDKTTDKAIVNIEREISRLHTTSSMIEGIVQVAEKKQIDNDFIRNWLRDLVDISYDARDVLDDFVTFSSCIITAEEASNPVNFISSLIMKYIGGSSSDTSNIPLAILNRLEKDIRSVRERFDEKKKDGKTFATLKSVVGGGSESIRTYRRPEVGPFINKQTDGPILGRDEVKQGIMEKMLHPSDRVHVVAIWGMGGIGKTTLAQSIYHDGSVKEDDYPTKNRRWLCVGENKFSAEKVIREIVNDQKTTGIGNLQTKLVDKLMGHRFFIVLDDVWDVDGSEWDLLLNPLTHVGNGGLIIITTQKTEVCTAINIQTTYDLMPLSEEDSWSIFESCAYVNGKSDSTPDLKGIGKEIVKKLNGFPLALKVVGCSLLDKDSSTWKNFLESDGKLRNDDEVMSALRWSYNHLPPHLKMCFTYCTLFPKDHVFDNEKVLIEMWMAHDLIKKQEQKRPEDVGAQYLKELVNASLLQCVDGKYMMHDMIYDLALLLSNGEFATANGSLPIDKMETVRHITITPDDYSKIPSLRSSKKLLTLYTISSGEEDRNRYDDLVLDDVFKKLKSIRVLVLSGEWINEILDCISELKHLRYLDVSETSVKCLPASLCHLYNLQMIAAPLDAVLPRNIVNMVNLRYVRANLSTCKGVGKLTSLQELSSIHICEGDNIRELGDMQILRGKLTIKGLGNVEKLEGDVGALMEKQTLMDDLELESTISEEVLDSLGCPPNLKYLRIDGYTGVKPPSWMVDGKHKFAKIQILKLSNCPKLEFLSPLGELTSLKHLSLKSLHGVKRLGKEFYGKLTKQKVFFSSLESLRFYDMKGWEEWDDIIIKNSNVSFFPRLTRLEIHRCPKLLIVLPVVKEREDDEHPIMNYANFMTSLSSLEIFYCDGLKKLQLRALVSLKDLDISHCKSLVKINHLVESNHQPLLDWHDEIKHIRNISLSSGKYKCILVDGIVENRWYDDHEEKEENNKEKILRDPDYGKDNQDDDHSDDDLHFRSRSESQLFTTNIMASAIGIAMISTILQPMAAKAMDIIKDKGKAIVRSMADKATDKAMDKVMHKETAMVVDNIERDIHKLQKTLCMIEGIVQVAEEKQIHDVFIRNWLQDLVDIGYDARDVLDDFITFSSCIITAEEDSNPVNFISKIFSSFLPSNIGGSSNDRSKLPLANLNRLEKDIRGVRERFDKKKKGKTFAALKFEGPEGPESVKNRRSEVGRFLTKQRDGLFLGRKEVKQGIMEKMLHPSDRVHVVAIWGMGGIGKTTLAQSIYNDERVKEDEYLTKNRKWLCVGENKFSAEKVIREIVHDQKTTGIGNLPTNLVEKLSGDRFLIVLDDVWDVDRSEWDSLFNQLTDVGKGGLIIITTRRREVCTATNTQTTYDLQPLSEEDSWSIFESCAYVNGESDSTPDLKGIGKEIVKKLNGFPLALKVVGGSLLEKDSSTWTNFLESNDWMLIDDDNDNHIMSVLRWSYNHLGRHLKTCFTYCSLFPKGHVFIEKVLVEMWMAHDLIKKEKQTRPEDVGAHYFEQLINASLLQCVDGKYTMHDLIHDLALLVSNEEFASLNSSLRNDQMKKVRHITVTPGDYSKIPRLYKMEKLLTLYTTNDEICTPHRFEYSVLDDVFKQFKSIRVLVLSSERVYEIPDSTSELKHLRYLDVSKTRVKSLPDSLCHLYNLQLIATPDVELPRDIVNISSLRYVRGNLSTCKGVGKLTSLQELSSIHVCKDDNIRELGDMQRLRGKLTIKGLENVTSSKDAAGALMEKQTLMDELELVFNQHSAKSSISAQVLDAFACPPNLTHLKIVGYTELPRRMVDRDKLQTLELSDCPKLESIPPLGELISLKHLSLLNVGVKRLEEEFYGKFTNSTKVLFPSLESLVFNDMKGWEQWDDIIIINSNVSFFPLLTRLEIKDCAKLVSVLPVVKNLTSKRKREDKHPIMNAADFMKSLSSLKIWNCDGLERLQLDALVSLKELDISDCSSLVKITSSICLASTIERLQISQCEHLKKIDFERLPSLKSLDIRSCDKLISIPCLIGIKFLYLTYCKSLTTLCINDRGLDSLEYLLISDCPVLELTLKDESSSSSGAVLLEICTDKKQIFTKLFQGILAEFENSDETEANNSCKLRSLKSLRISRCKDLMSLPEHFYKLLSLNSLKIENFPKLQSLPPDFYKLSSLKRLEIISCPQLQSLPPDFHTLPSLNSLKIVDCPQLHSLPADGFPPSMKSLELLNCPLLYERCKDEYGFDWHKIKRIPKLTIFGDHNVHRYGGDR